MNKIRRKNLQTIIDRLEDIKADLEEITYEEEEYRDNIPKISRAAKSTNALMKRVTI